MFGYAAWMDLQDPEWIAFAEHFRIHALPKLMSSDFSLSITPKDPNHTDLKFAVEIGASMMLDKPMIFLVQPGTKIPEKVMRVADHILEFNPDDPKAMARLQEAITKIVGKKSDASPKGADE